MNRRGSEENRRSNGGFSTVAIISIILFVVVAIFAVIIVCAVKERDREAYRDSEIRSIYDKLNNDETKDDKRARMEFVCNMDDLKPGLFASSDERRIYAGLKTQALSEMWNPETGYYVLIDDYADLLADIEEDKLKDEMVPMTEYGNVVFNSIDHNNESAESYTISYYEDLMGEESGAVFVIDMDNREIVLWTDGEVYRGVGTDNINDILDNTYVYAGDGDFYKCAAKTFQQLLRYMD